MNDFLNECINLQKNPRLKLTSLFKHKHAQAFLNISFLLESKNAQQILYHAILVDYLVPKCTRIGCENRCIWFIDKRRYRTACSGSCATKMSAIIIQTNNLLRIGVSHHTKLPSHMVKIKATNNKKFGKDFYSQTDEFLERVIKTNNERYGYDYCTQVPIFKEKAKITSINNCGADHWLSTPKGQEKFETIMLNIHGVKYAQQSPIIKQNTKTTCNKKYGVDYALQVPEFVEKRIDTARKNHYGKDLVKLLDDPNWINKIYKEHINGKTVHQIADETGLLSNNLCKIFNRHGLEPIQHNTRYLESKLRDYFIKFDEIIEFRNKKIIKPKEIDLVFPNIKLGIECDGAYYHTEEFGRNKNYHIDKTNNAAKAGYELWHFWDWEVSNKWNCVIDKINQKLGRSISIGARKLSVKIISSEDKIKFINEYHIQNDCPSTINIGLVDENDDILMVSTFGRSRFNKDYDFELLRMCSKHGFNIAGGASKLLKYYSTNFMKSTQTLVSYCNLRFSTGNVYEKIGFSKIRINPPGYCYVRRGQYAGSRNQWQKKQLAIKLDIYDPILSEIDNMKMNGYFRAWDCGQAVYVYSKI